MKLNDVVPMSTLTRLDLLDLELLIILSESKARKWQRLRKKIKQMVRNADSRYERSLVWSNSREEAVVKRFGMVECGELVWYGWDDQDARYYSDEGGYYDEVPELAII